MMGSPVEDVVEMEGCMAAGQVTKGFTQVEWQPPAAGRSLLLGGGLHTLGLFIQDSLPP